MAEHRVYGTVIDATRMRSSKFGNPRYVVTVNESGVHMTYRTMPDMPIGAEIPELVGKQVMLTIKHHYGRNQIMYGGEYPTPALAGNRPEDNTPARLPEAMRRQIVAEHRAQQPADRFHNMSAEEIYHTLRKEEEEFIKNNPRYDLLLEAVDLMQRLEHEGRKADAETVHQLIIQSKAPITHAETGHGKD